MRYALLSDVHSRRQRLEAVLADAKARGADRIVSLGDIGGDACVALLHSVGALAVFGNYEVSGWGRLAEPQRSWVYSWPPALMEDNFVAVHAAPWWPEAPRTVEQCDRWLQVTGHPWHALFPYMTGDGDQLWRALMELEMTGRTLLFHGHTHRQTVWRLAPSGAIQRLTDRTIDVEESDRYVVGIGSVGLPDDGGWAAYTLYDAEVARIDLIRLSRQPSYRS